MGVVAKHDDLLPGFREQAVATDLLFDTLLVGASKPWSAVWDFWEKHAPEHLRSDVTVRTFVTVIAEFLGDMAYHHQPAEEPLPLEQEILRQRTRHIELTRGAESYWQFLNQRESGG